MTPLATLQLRLKQLGYEGPLETADDCRAGILSTLSSEAVCCRHDGKLLKFSAMFERVWGVPVVARERVARAKRRAG